MIFRPTETLSRRKKQSMVIFVIILSLLVVAGLAGTLKDALAGGSVSPSNPKVNLYFHGDSSYPYKLDYKTEQENYGLLTIKYDGDEIVKDLRISYRESFGGVTSGRVRKRASVYVKIKIYDYKGTKLGENHWEKDLHDGDTCHYSYKVKSSVFEMYLVRSKNTVTVQFL